MFIPIFCFHFSAKQDTAMNSFQSCPASLNGFVPSYTPHFPCSYKLKKKVKEHIDDVPCYSIIVLFFPGFFSEGMHRNGVLEPLCAPFLFISVTTNHHHSLTCTPMVCGSWKVMSPPSLSSHMHLQLKLTCLKLVTSEAWELL